MNWCGAGGSAEAHPAAASPEHWASPLATRMGEVCVGLVLMQRSTARIADCPCFSAKVQISKADSKHCAVTSMVGLATVYGQLVLGARGSACIVRGTAVCTVTAVPLRCVPW